MCRWSSSIRDRNSISTFAGSGRAPRLSRCRSTSARNSSRRRLSARPDGDAMAYPAGYKYTKDHEWIDISGDRGTVGITDYAQQQLGDVVYIDLPDIGMRLKAGQSFGTIESVKAVSELYSPAAGEVVEVNSALKDKPEQVNGDPHGSWM